MPDYEKLEHNKATYRGLSADEQFALYRQMGGKGTGERKKKRKNGRRRGPRFGNPMTPPPAGQRVNYDAYLTSEHWRQTRRRKLRAVDNKCERCGATRKLQVHHKHYRTLFAEADEDLEVVCQDCHRRIHKGDAPW